MAWGWPQWVVLIHFVCRCLFDSVLAARKEATTSSAVSKTLGNLIFWGGFAYILHVGGFW